MCACNYTCHYEATCACTIVPTPIYSYAIYACSCVYFTYPRKHAHVQTYACMSISEFMSTRAYIIDIITLSHNPRSLTPIMKETANIYYSGVVSR